MTWLLPAVVGALCGTLVLLLVYIYLYVEYREKYLAIWAASWGLSALRFCLQLAAFYGQNSLLLRIAEQLAVLMSGYLLLWGIYSFVGKRLPRWCLVVPLVGTAWIVVGNVAGLSLLRLTIPIFTFLGFITLAAGVLLLQQKEVTGYPPQVTGWALIVWGLHRLDFPFLRPAVWFAPWGFLLTAVLEIMVALGMVLTYFQRNKQELYRTEERLRLLVEQMPVMVDAFDAEGRVVFWNQECERVTGYSAAEVTYNPQAMYLFYPDDAYRQEMMTLWRERGNDYRNWEWDIVCKDGRVRTIAWSNISDHFPIPGWATWGIGVDVTDRIQAEAALRQTQKMESLGILAGGIAHDFNNLLTVIMAQISLARRKLENQHPAQQNLDHTIAASERAADLARQMLAFSGRIRFEVRPLNLNDLVRANLPLIQSGLSKQIELVADLAETLPPVEGDIGQLQQVVMNLILNGAQAIGERPGMVRVSTTLHEVNAAGEKERDYLGHTLPSGRYVCLTVADNGQGMDPVTMGRIFEPFFTTKELGHGLGLAAVLGIVQGHHGGIFLGSKVGEGTTFRILLPVATESKPEPEVGAAEAVTAVTGLVLVIDDEILIRQVVGEILSEEDIHTLMAATGEEGLHLFRAHEAEIELVLLDLSMPGMGGLETWRAIRHINPHMPVLLSSGYSQIEVNWQELTDAPVGFVSKPYQPQTLLTAVRQLSKAAQNHQKKDYE